MSLLLRQRIRRTTSMRPMSWKSPGLAVVQGHSVAAICTAEGEHPNKIIAVLSWILSISRGHVQGLFFCLHLAAQLDPVACPAFRAMLNTRASLSLRWIIAVLVATTLHWISLLLLRASPHQAAPLLGWDAVSGAAWGRAQVQRSRRAGYRCSTVVCPAHTRHSTGALESQTKRYWFGVCLLVLSSSKGIHFFHDSLATGAGLVLKRQFF